MGGERGSEHKGESAGSGNEGGRAKASIVGGRQLEWTTVKQLRVGFGVGSKRLLGLVQNCAARSGAMVEHGSPISESKALERRGIPLS